MADENWLTLADAFHAAAVDGDGWYAALAGLAEATGSRHGQLVCMADQAGDSLNLLTDVDPELPRAFAAAGGSDPSKNPRRRAGLSRPPLTVVAESDFITPDEIRRDPHYQEFALPWDVPFVCLTTLERRNDMLVGLAVIRDERQGHIDDAGRRLFATIAPHVRAAVRTNLALADSSSALLLDAFENLTLPAFVCDDAGTVRRLSPSAESLLSGRRGLALQGGKLSAHDADENTALNTAILTAANRAKTPDSAQTRENLATTVLVHAVDGESAPLIIDVTPLPSRRLPFAFDARVLVLVRGAPKDDLSRLDALQTAYDMTPAEAQIALMLLRSESAENIARARNVSVGTVRAQIKSLLAKAGVSRQIELVARLAQL